MAFRENVTPYYCQYGTNFHSIEPNYSPTIIAWVTILLIVQLSKTNKLTDYIFVANSGQRQGRCLLLYLSVCCLMKSFKSIFSQLLFLDFRTVPSASLAWESIFTNTSSNVQRISSIMILGSPRNSQQNKIEGSLYARLFLFKTLLAEKLTLL